MARASFPVALSGDDITVIAGYLGCEVAAVRAVLTVESAGKGFSPDGRPIIRNEPHILYRELSGALRDRAVAEGLAAAKAGMVAVSSGQAARYAWLGQASLIDETAALRSCSWGMAQIMGFNHEACGFDTVQDFVAAMRRSEGAQLYAMARFMVSQGLQKHLAAKNWAGFAKGYNGAGYRANKYDEKLAAAYDKRPASEKVIPPAATAAQLAALIGEAAPPPVATPVPVKPVPPPKPAPKASTWADLIVAFFAAIFKRT